MADAPPGVRFTFLDYVALGFILPGSEEILRRGKAGWPIWVPSFALGIITLVFRDRSPQLVGWLLTWLRAPKELAAAIAEKAELKKQIEELKRMPVSAPVHRRAIHTVGFTYLPGSPIQNGWSQAYNDDGMAEFGSDPDMPGSLRMKVVNSEVAIHYNLPPHATLADNLEFTAKCTNAANPTMIFTRLVVCTKDGLVEKFVDIKYYLGDQLRAKPTEYNFGRDPNKWLPEQTVYWPATILPGGKLGFNIDLREAVDHCLGNQGWVLRSIQGLRLRGNLSISPMVLSKTSSD